MIDKLYTAIRQRLKTEVTSLKWIDLDTGQLDNPENNYPFPFPCVFIDFERVDWQDAGERMQDGLVMMTVRIASRIFDQTHSKTQDTLHDTFTKAMTALQILTTVHAKLQGYSDGTYFNRLSRVSTETEKRNDGLKVFQMRYTFSARDKSAMKTYELPTGTELAITQGIDLSHLMLSLAVDDETPAIGSTVNFAISVANIGQTTGNNASVAVGIGLGFAIVSNDGGVTFDGNGMGTWDAGDVDADDTATLNVVATVLASGSYRITAVMTYDEQANPASHNSASVTLIPE